MRASVVAAARAFQETYEGRCAFMYVDRLGLVTTGIGNLIDPVASALALPWRQPSGSPATLNQVQDEWCSVKDRQDLRGAPIAARETITMLRLTDADVDALFDRETARVWAQIVAGYPDAEEWPAPAQLATLSMCWAMGAGRIVPGSAFQYPHWAVSARARSWAICAQECKMNGVGVEGRNAANRALFLAAAAAGADPDALPHGPWLGSAPGDA